MSLVLALSALVAAEPMLVWNADPVLLSLGPVMIRWYGLLFASGFLIGFFICRSIFVREGKDLADLDRLLITMIVSTLVGARLGHCFFYHPDYYLSAPWKLLEIWKGGLASHGAAIGIAIGLWLYKRKTPGQSYLWILDRMAICVALGGSFIRIGNFFNSEIIGTPANVPWAVVFARFDDMPRHPAQLYESASYFTIFILLATLYRRRGPAIAPGLLSGLFLTLVFTARFLIEFVKRRQADYAMDFPLRVGQMLSIIPVLIGIALIAHALRSRGRGSADGAAPRGGASS